MRLRRQLSVLGAAVALASTAGCGTGASVRNGSLTPDSPAARSASAARTTAPPPPASAPSETPRPGPLIVIDPGHSVPVHAVDPATGLDVSDYENEPEMRDAFAVAQLVRVKLVTAGYRVVLTKATVDTPASLGARAAIANAAHAALAVSIHDQAGPNGGIGFEDGNNVVYYQSVGAYRETPAGRKVAFADPAVAAASESCARKFQADRARAQGVPVRLQGNTGYDLGGRGLQAGNIWIVQLLSRVPWIYNEAGGNSAGTIGLDAADRQRYADGLVAGVRACVPIE